MEILTHVVFGPMAAILVALGQSSVSRWINTAFLERQNATDRPRNARKVRKAYTFSKDWRVHESMTYFSMYSYNFCWPVRTLTERDGGDASDTERRRWLRGWPTTSGRCGNGSRCRAFNAVETPPERQLFRAIRDQMSSESSNSSSSSASSMSGAASRMAFR